MRGRRHVTVLKGWKERGEAGEEEGGENAREADAERGGAPTTPQKWAKF